MFIPRKSLLPVLAILGLAVAIGTIILGHQTPAIVRPTIPSVPFASYVAGAGMIETSTENITIGAPVSGIVMAIYVKWGDWVNKGDPLFKIDDRDLQAQLLPAGAKVKEAEATLAKLRNLLKLGEGLTVGSSISALELSNRRYDVGVAEAVLASAQAHVEELKMEVERRTVRALGRAASSRSRPTLASLWRTKLFLSPL